MHCPHAGGDSGPGSLDPALATILLAAGRKVESFPSDFASALLSGKVRTQMQIYLPLLLHSAEGLKSHKVMICIIQVTVEILKRYLEMESNFFAKFVWGIQGQSSVFSVIMPFTTFIPMLPSNQASESAFWEIHLSQSRLRSSVVLEWLPRSRQRRLSERITSGRKLTLLVQMLSWLSSRTLCLPGFQHQH